MKQRRLVSLLSAGIAVTLAACSGNDDKGASTSSTTAGAAATAGGAVIAPDGLGVASFGDSADAALAKLTAAFGAPPREFAPPD